MSEKGRVQTRGLGKAGSVWTVRGLAFRPRVFAGHTRRTESESAALPRSPDLLETYLRQASRRTAQRKCSGCAAEEEEMLKAPLQGQLGTGPLPGGGTELEEEEEEETAAPVPLQSRSVASAEFKRRPAGVAYARNKGKVPLESWVVGNHASPGRESTGAGSLLPLESWVIGGPATAGTNTIKCDGSGGIVVQADGTGDAQQTACLKDCIVKHEESHKADALAANAKICDGVASGKTVTVDTAAERKATEVKASNAEIDCLKAKPETDECKDIIAARITQMEQYRDSF